MKTDMQLTQDLQAEFDSDPGFDNRGVIIAAGNGVVTLAGHIRSHAERSAAEAAAKRVAGVCAIANDICVDPVAAAQHSDSAIAQAVLNALQRDPLLAGTDIKAIVHDGWVTLDGAACAWHEKTAAERCVREVSGIKGITNCIKLRFPVTAGEVEDEIRQSFQRHAKLEARKVSVCVNDATVTLTGEVSSWQQHDDAEAVARAAPGVTQVKNMLCVRSEMQPLPQ